MMLKEKKHLKRLVMGLTTGRCIFFMSLMTKFLIISTKYYQKIKCRGFVSHYVDWLKWWVIELYTRNTRNDFKTKKQQ